LRSTLTLTSALLLGLTTQVQAEMTSAPEAIAAAVASPNRTPAYTERDVYRHPAETLAFFGVQPSDTVVEFSPGGGWYTEILAPLLAEDGTLILAQPKGGYFDRLKAKLDAKPEMFGKATLVPFPPDGAITPGSVDVVLTFRNVHNLVMGGAAEGAFKMFYAMLKPGGTLGVVDHRLPETRDDAEQKSSGYLKVSTVEALAKQAGFVLEDSSEINANDKDTAEWPEGVWTLPPTLKLGDTDKEKYLEIGESDRMTLRFRKPAG